VKSQSAWYFICCAFVATIFLGAIAGFHRTVIGHCQVTLLSSHIMTAVFGGRCSARSPHNSLPPPTNCRSSPLFSGSWSLVDKGGNLGIPTLL